jgi:hypothetical protein
MTWTGSNVGKPPPTPKKLKALTESLIKELDLTGARASELRQAMRPWLYPTHVDSEPAAPSPPEVVRESAGQLSEQLGLNVNHLLDRAGLR